MKKIMTIAIMAIASLTASAATEQTSPFSSVSVNAPVRLVIVHGPSYSVRLMSQDKQLTSAVTYDVKDDKLYVSARDLSSLEDNDNQVTVLVTTPHQVDYKVASDVEQTSYRSIKRTFHPFHHRSHRG